jgi:hypothetical protein
LAWLLSDADRLADLRGRVDRDVLGGALGVVSGEAMAIVL